MPTNRLGKGTVNIPVNWLTEERDALGRIAMKHDLSLSALIRRLTIEGLARTEPGIASSMIQGRQARRSARLRIEFTEAVQ